MLKIKTHNKTQRSQLVTAKGWVLNPQSTVVKDKGEPRAAFQFNFLISHGSFGQDALLQPGISIHVSKNVSENSPYDTIENSFIVEYIFHVALITVPTYEFINAHWDSGSTCHTECSP